jgi:hypothetical protein
MVVLVARGGKCGHVMDTSLLLVMAGRCCCPVVVHPAVVVRVVAPRWPALAFAGHNRSSLAFIGLCWALLAVVSFCWPS